MTPAELRDLLAASIDAAGYAAFSQSIDQALIGYRLALQHAIVVMPLADFYDLDAVAAKAVSE